MKVRIMKSKILLQLRYRFIYIAFSIVLIVLVLTNSGYAILVPFYMLFIIKKHRNLLPYIGLISVFYILCVISFNHNEIDNSGPFAVKVIKVTHIDDYYKLLGRIDNNVVNIYVSDAEEVLIGCTYNVTGILESSSGNTIPHTFNYKNYLLSQNIKYTLYAEEMIFVRKSISIYALSEKIENYIDTYLPKSKAFIKTFLIADKSDIDQNVIDGINYLGISHMFAVSGYHIGLLVLGVGWILKELKITKKYAELIMIVILLVYMVITSFAASVVRASLLYILLVANARFQWKLSVLDILSVIFIGLLLVRPYYFYNAGFVLSFFITIVLILSQKILHQRTKFQAVVLVSFIAFIASFPIVINMNYQINLLTLIFNIFIIYIMTVVILPLAYITFILPIFDSIYYVVMEMFTKVLDICVQFDMFIITGYISNIYEVMIIYIIIYFIFLQFERKKSILVPLIILLIVTIVILNSSKLDPRKQIVFLDVEGDSTLIKDSFDQCTIVIDTGEVDEYDTVVHYLQSKHIYKIDYLIVSHFHSDHYGEANDIYSNFKVSHIVTKDNVGNYQSQMISCGSLSFYIYEMSYTSDNENNNSIILSLFLEEDHYLFVGDSENERETEFIEKYHIDVDYLKVGHHGSITSTSQAFIDAINPEQAYIMVHRDNRNNHPDNRVIERLEENQISILRTDQLGSIEVTYLFGKASKKYYEP